MASEQPDRGLRGLPGGKSRYSGFALARNAMNYHQDWQRAWRDANAVGRHISLNWDAVATMSGQMAPPSHPPGGGLVKTPSGALTRPASKSLLVLTPEYQRTATMLKNSH